MKNLEPHIEKHYAYKKKHVFDNILAFHPPIFTSGDFLWAIRPLPHTYFPKKDSPT